MEVKVQTSFENFIKRMGNYFCEDICCVIFSYIFDPFEYLKLITDYSNKENCIVTYNIKEYELISKYIQNDKRFIKFHTKPRKKLKSGKLITWGSNGCVSVSSVEKYENRKEFIIDSFS